MLYFFIHFNGGKKEEDSFWENKLDSRELLSSSVSSTYELSIEINSSTIFLWWEWISSVKSVFFDIELKILDCFGEGISWLSSK